MDKLTRIGVVLGFHETTRELHARYNLEGVLIDIEYAGGHADKVCITTIRRVISQLVEAENIWETP